ncbi:MAG TPA: response regulator transcription factor [Candidatus Obscuribacterales bacterium]
MEVPIKVMLVEDQAITRLGLKAILKKYPAFEVVAEAGDGVSAVATALKVQPNVVLLDIGLPGMDGIEVAHELKRRASHIRVLMLTAQDQDEAVFASLAAGADGYCLKSTGMDSIVDAIQTINTGAAWLDPGIAKRVLRNSAQAQKPTDSGSQRTRFSLSPREYEVLDLVVAGCGNREIAERLVVSEDTVKTHMRHIMEKLAVSDRTQAAVKALREGLL